MTAVPKRLLIQTAIMAPAHIDSVPGSGTPAEQLHDFEEVPPRLVDERRVGRDAVEQPGFGKVSNFRDLGSVGEEFHVFALAPAEGGFAAA